MTYRLGALLTHPIQYYSPWLKRLAQNVDLEVYYAHRQTGAGQAAAGFGVEFEWDVPLLEGYQWQWLENVSANPGLNTFGGCDTPGIGDIVRRKQFDALLMFGWNKKCFLQAWQAALRCGTPVLVRLDSQLVGPQNDLLRLAKRAVYSMALPWSADYLSPGRRTDAYLRHFRVPEARIHRLPHMVDNDRFATAADAARRDGTAAALRARHGAGEADTVFLFVGKLLERKRPDLLLEAFARSRDRPAQLWYVGDGPMADALKERAARENLPVRFLGFLNQTELPAAYAAADCLVMPSDSRETWGLVVNEALASGLPVIASIEAGCTAELVREGETGWIMQRPDAGHLSGLLDLACQGARHLSRSRLMDHIARSSYDVGATCLHEIARTVSRRRGWRARSQVGRKTP